MLNLSYEMEQQNTIHIQSTINEKMNLNYDKPFNSLMQRNNSTISNVNTEMSSALRNSIMHLDEICFRVKNCLEEISQNNQRYEMLKKIPKLDLPDNPKEITSRISLNAYALLSQNRNDTGDDVPKVLCHKSTETDIRHFQEIHEVLAVQSRIETRRKIKGAKKESISQIAEKRKPIEARLKSIESKSKAIVSKLKTTEPNLKTTESKLKTTDSKLEPTESKLKLKEMPEKQQIRQNFRDSRRTEMKLKYLKKTVAQIPSGNKKDRLLRLLSYNSLSNRARVDLVDHLKRRVSRITLPQRPPKPNVIALPKKQTTSKRFLIDERFSDSLFFSEGRPINKNKGIKKSRTETRLTKSNKPQKKHVEPAPVPNTNTIQKPSTPPSNIDITVPNDQVIQQQIQTIRRFVVDSLDTLRIEDLEPIASEYPRRDNIYYSQMQNLRSSFLYKLTCRNNEKMMKFLFSVPERLDGLKVESKEAWNEYSQQRRRRKEAIIEKLRPLLAEIKATKKKKLLNNSTINLATINHVPSSKNRSTSLVSFMNDPLINHFKTYTVMPIQVSYNNNNLRRTFDGNTPTSTWKHYQSIPTQFAINSLNKLAKPKVNTRWEDSSTFNTTLRKMHHKQLICNKYKKTASQNLINFVNRQKPLYEYTARNDAKQILDKSFNYNKESVEKFSPSAYKNSKCLSRDISRVVGTIEEKIVKVLSDPSENQKTFDDIEQEIKDVLSVMQQMKDNTKMTKSSFRLPTLLSEENSEKSDILSKKSSASFKTGNSNVSLNSLHSQIYAMCTDKESTKAEKYCNEILKEIADTKEELRMIQEKEFLADLEESNNALINVVEQEEIDITGRELTAQSNDTINECKSEIIGDEEQGEWKSSELIETQRNDEVNTKEKEVDLDGILLKLQEFSFKEAEIDYENSKLPYENAVNENDVTEDDVNLDIADGTIDEVPSNLRVHEITIKNTINQRIKEIIDKKEEIARMNQLINVNVDEEQPDSNEQIDGRTMKESECLHKQQNRGDIRSNPDIQCKDEVQLKEQIVNDRAEEILYSTNRSLKQRQNAKFKCEYVIPTKRQKLTKMAKKNAQNSKRNKKIENDSRKDRPTIVTSTSRFLTPYFQAIKQYRNKLESSSTQNILDFLDKLTNIASSNKIIVRHRRVLLQKPNALQVVIVEGRAINEWQTQYSFTSSKWDEAEIYFSENSSYFNESEPYLREVQPYSMETPRYSWEARPYLNEIETFFSDSEVESSDYKSTTVLSPIEGIKQLVDNLNAMQPYKENPSTNNVKCKKNQRKNQSKLVKKRISIGKKSIDENLEPISTPIVKENKIRNANDEEYSSVLSAIYGIVFSVMYVGLQMNFSCNS